MSATVATFAYSFTLCRVAPRDELVFKSAVRVLQGKTRHQWHHSDDLQSANLVVVGDYPPDPATPAEDLSRRCTIHVSATPQEESRGFSLVLPLRIVDVLVQLDRAGGLIAKRKAASKLAPKVAPSPAATTSQPDLIEERVVLTRWPEAALLRPDIRYLKIATVLTGRPVSINELAARTQFPIQLCQDFVDSLKAARLLRVFGDGHELKVPRKTTKVVNHDRGPESPHHGLIARIRSCLEMFVGTAGTK